MIGNQPYAGRLRALVVDDSICIQEMLSFVLAGMGFKVVRASDAVEALFHIQKGVHRFGLVVTDYQMPGLSGVDLIHQILTLAPLPPPRIVLYTGSLDACEVQAFRARVEGTRLVRFVAKGGTLDELREVFAELCGLKVR